MKLFPQLRFLFLILIVYDKCCWFLKWHKIIFVLVPECTNKINSNEPKANSACKLSDITACGVNQACQQTDPKSPWGTCTCLSGYSLQEDNVSQNKLVNIFGQVLVI